MGWLFSFERVFLVSTFVGEVGDVILCFYKFE